MHPDDIFYNTRYSVVLYPYALCNLNCTYCFIDKNPALSVIDKMLKDSFEDPNYYIDFITEFVNPNNLTFMQFWGGEPTLGFNRLPKFMDKALSTFPKLKMFTFSSNTTTTSYVEDVFALLDSLKHFNNREFMVDIQVSYDGPGKLTDMCRGDGVSAKVWKNLEKLSERLYLDRDLLNHVKFRFHNKETFSQESLRILGESDETILHYWKDLADMKTMVTRFGMPNVEFQPTLLTLAGPTKYTSEDGLYFADFCKRSRRLMEENRELCDYTCAFVPYFKLHKRHGSTLNDWDRRCYGYCNLCSGQIGFLPNDVISVCHSSFVDLVADYKKIVNEKVLDIHTINNKFFEYNTNMLIYQKSDYAKLNSKMGMIECNPKSIINATAIIIKTLADAGLVEEKYKQEGMAFKAAAAYVTLVPVCYRNNFNVSGSLGIMNVGELKLFLNGALEVILDEQL